LTATWEKPDPYIRIHVLIGRESAEAILKLCKRERFRIYEEGVIWLIQHWAKCGELRDFEWSFNHCNRPKYWFGDRVLNDLGKRGTIYGMEWVDEDTEELTGETLRKRGWYYKCKFVAPTSFQTVHQSKLEQCYEKAEEK